MKITCSRDDLAARLGVVSRGLSTRGTVQILAGVLLQVQDGRLELAATDMELSLRATLAANVESEGSAVVPGRLLTDIVRLLPEEQVVLEHKVE
jgi:DNA polymerase-3 subunit beta